MNEYIRLPWQEWIIEDCIDRGSYGGVYKARRVSDGMSSPQYCAVKVIEIPSDEVQAAAVEREHPDPEERRAWYQDLVDHVQDEIRVMTRLKDHPNVVKLLDDCVIPEEEPLRWTVYIRMELLTPFPDYLITEEMTQEDVLRLGTDLCTALEAFEDAGIIHRDIKPENILVDENGTFKLGDFGISRVLEHSSVGMSLKGTFSFMAPEVYHGNPYDYRADQYSLGVVLFRLMNNNRGPFIPAQCRMVSYQDRENALRKRMKGEVLPDPAEASEDLTLIIKKACAYRPEDRFKTAAEMKAALQCVRQGEEPEITGVFDLSETDRLRQEEKRRKKRTAAVVLAAVIALAAFMALFTWVQTRKTEEEKWIEEGRRQKAAIEADGIRKDNALEELDLRAVSEEQDRLNDPSVTENASVILPILEQEEAEAKKDHAQGRETFDSCRVRMIYSDKESAVGTSVNYTGRTDSLTNTEQVQEFYSLYYYTCQNGEWMRAENDSIPDAVLETMEERWLPEGFVSAKRSGRDAVRFPEGFWLGRNEVYDGNVTLRTAAVWTNADGSLDLYLLCRNGTERPAAQYAYWISLYSEDGSEILKIFGNLDPGEVTIGAGTIGGYLLHLDAEERKEIPQGWSLSDLVCYTAGNNSNYRAE